MARILTGIQSSGVPHLGNILGAILPAIELSKQQDNHCIYFIADLHSLTTIKDAEGRIAHRNAVAAAWLAFGLDVNKNILFRQSKVAEVCELAWYLNCYTPFPMLANAHSFKDKSEKLSDVNAGLFTYPVLMAADILLYDANVVPVGKDQLQHLEMTRDIAGHFNHLYGDIFVIPEARIDERVMIIPGIDGQKMSKSYNNFIDVFLPEKELKKVVMSIVTDSRGLEEPKDPETCNVFRLFSLVAPSDEVEKMKQSYLAGGFGYGHAKQALLGVLLDRFAGEREAYNRYMSDLGELDRVLGEGENRARAIATPVLDRVRKAVGF